MKKWYLRIALVVALVLSLWVVRNILEIKSPHGINQTRAFYEQKKDTVDVLCVGSSHVHCGINTATLWDDFGIAAYDFSAAEQPLWITYHYLLEAYKTQSPKLVVLDVFSPARFKDDYHYKWLEESVYGMKFSRNKLDMLKVSVEEDKLKEYFPSFLTYHSRYADPNREDIVNIFGSHKQKSISKGYTPGFEIIDQSEKFGGWEELDDYHLTDKSREYLGKIIELTREHGSELCIIVVPYNFDERDNITYSEIAEIAEKNSIEFINFNELIDDVGIDKRTDFNDHTHLNYGGSVKFTEYLGQIVSYEYGKDGIMVDRRNTKGYESWDEFSMLIDQQRQEKEK